ncbi:RagB/SusD family nutrient uptake outer membrane protein [Niabella terrae]
MRIYIIIVLGVSIFLSSCKKFLDFKADAKQAIPSTLQDVQALLDNAGIMNHQGISLPEASADDYYVSDDSYNKSTVQTKDREAYIWHLGDYYFTNDWAVCYKPVYISNLCLEVLGNINRDQDPEQWDRLKASALFYRSYSFLQLVTTFAKAYDPATAEQDPGIPARLSSDFNVRSVRNSVAEVYNQILSDLKMASRMLPNLTDHSFRPSKAATYALLARTFLFMNEYDSVYKYSKLSYDIYHDLLDFNLDIPDYNASLPFPQFNKEILFYSANNTAAVYFSRPDIAIIDSNLYKMYAEDDLRKKGFFYADLDGYLHYKGMYTDNIYSPFTGITTAEVYLMLAESMARIGMGDDALTLIYAMQQFRYSTPSPPLVNPDTSEIISLILAERRKELIFRALRWPDIKRLNKLTPSIVLKRFVNNQYYELPANDPRYALPLPKDIIDLTGMPQN